MSCVACVYFYEINDYCEKGEYVNNLSMSICCMMFELDDEFKKKK